MCPNDSLPMTVRCDKMDKVKNLMEDLNVDEVIVL